MNYCRKNIQQADSPKTDSKTGLLHQIPDFVLVHNHLREPGKTQGCNMNHDRISL